MKIYAIGYKDCCYFQSICNQHKNIIPITIYDDFPIDREKIRTTIIDLLQQQHIQQWIDFKELQFRSPQIVCCTTKYAVCIDGADAFNQIPNIGIYVHNRYLKHI